MTAQLVIVGTPIGNLGDWSPRARQTLEQVDLIACEDTRRTGLLLARHSIANPGLVVMNEHTEAKATDRVLDALSAGSSVAVVTDAGMPTISDPGALLVDRVAQAGFEVVVVPGPTAASAALALSGFVGGRYAFEGFLPRKGAERARRLAALAEEQRMLVLYEAPHRIARTIADLAGALGDDRACAIARELTKLHEDVWRGPLGQAAVALGEPRGEYVIVIDAVDQEPAELTDDDLVARLAQVDPGLSTRDGVDLVVAATGAPRRRVYELALKARP